MPDASFVFLGLCRRRLAVLLLCVAGALTAYAPALSGGLVWDDVYLVGENPFFKSPVFGLEVFRHWLFFDSFEQNDRIRKRCQIGSEFTDSGRSGVVPQQQET